MIWIGSSSTSLRKALIAHYDGHILSSDPFYLALDIPADSLCEDLSGVLLERLLPRMLLNAVSESEAVDLDEKEFLTDAVSNDILKNGEAESFRSKLCNALQQILSDNNRINIEGLLYFRLKHDLTILYTSITESIERHRSIYEKNRLLKLLRDHIREQAPQIEYLRVVGKASSYALYDIGGRSIRCIFPEEYTPEEHLLNSLLYLSPVTLDLSDLDHPELRDVLAEIFADRLI